jgi:alpha-1,2-mannosyltransferase
MLTRVLGRGPNASGRRYAAVILFIAALSALIYFGLLGRALGPSNEDFAVLHFAARSWLTGLDPYRPAFRLTPRDDVVLFPYPPQSAALLVPFGFLRLDAAALVWRCVNLAAIAVIVGLTVRRLRASEAPAPGMNELLVVAALVIGNSFTTKVVWQGQTSLVILAAVMTMWEAIPGRWVLAGICLAIAGLKPQAAVLFAVWLLLERQWRVLAAAAVATLLMAAYPFLTQGMVGSVSSWWTAVQGYGTEGPNALGSPRVVTLQSLVYTLGVQLPNLALVAVISTLVLWRFRNRFSRNAVPGLLLGLSVTFISGHDQDYVWLIPLATTLWIHAKRNPQRAVVLALLLVLVLTPLRLLRMGDLEALYHWRTALVLVLMGLAIRWTWHSETPRDEQAGAAAAPA